MEKETFENFIKTLKLTPYHDGEKLNQYILKSIERTAEGNDFTVLLSGGVDSTAIAFLLKRLNKTINAIVCGTSASPDIEWAEKASKYLQIPLKKIVINEEDVIQSIIETKKILKTWDPIKISIAIPLYCCLKNAENNIIFTGLGSEEIFAGYQRHANSRNINEECLNGLKQLWERDLSRDLSIAQFFNKELRTPFLDYELIQYALNIKPELKIKDGIKKWILRKTMEEIGLKKEFCYRPKKAAQYGSGVMKIIEKTARKRGVTIRELLDIFKN